jgi:GNAT superfamily N-acetyltransferase
MTDPGEVTVRVARDGEELEVRRVLDGAMLETEDVTSAAEAGDVLVAVAADGVVGALVLVSGSDVEVPTALEGPLGRGMHVDAMAVRRRRRGNGIGRALVEAALDRHGCLTVGFDDDVAAFYEALDFSIVAGEHRSWGVLERNE